MNATGPIFSLIRVEKMGPAALISLYQDCADFIRLATEAPIDQAMIQADLDYSVHVGGIFQVIQASGGEIVGVVDVVSSGFLGDERTGFINLLMLSPRFRGSGLGSAVLRRVESAIWANPVVDNTR